MKLSSFPQWGRTLFPVWLGQFASLFGSGLSEFALSIWVFQQTNSFTQFAFVLLFRIIPVILFSPLAGLMADRWDRRKIMLISDTGSALSTLAIAVLFYWDHLQPWHIYIATIFSSSFGAFQQPAYLSAISALVPEKSLNRVNGLLQMGQAVTEVLTPALAGFLMLAIGISGVILIDFSTFLFAVLMLFIVRFPKFDEATEIHGKLKHDFQFTFSGFSYLRKSPDVQKLLTYNLIIAFFSGMLGVLLIPLFLAVSSVSGMGVILSIAGCGLLTGSMVLSIWGGSFSRVKTMLLAGIIFGVGLFTAGFSSTAVWVAVGAFVAHFSLPFVNGLNQALWQTIIDHKLHGRMFALRQMLIKLTQPFSILLAGFLGDRVFEPMTVSKFGFISSQILKIGYGPGRGAALQVTLIGIVITCVSLAAIVSSALGKIEDGTRVEVTE